MQTSEKKAAFLLTSSGPSNCSKLPVQIQQFHTVQYQQKDPLHGTEIDIKHFNDYGTFKNSDKLVVQSCRLNNTLHSI